MKYGSKAELVKGVRSHVHTLSSLLTGISASLYCSKIATEKQSAQSHIDEAQQLAEEAEKELAGIREILREFDCHAGPEKGAGTNSP